MNLRHHAFWVASVLPLMVLGCGESGSVDFWQQLQDEDYRSFMRAPGYERSQPSSAPHGDTVDIYINEVLHDALQAEEPIDQWPEGALIVKDGFRSDGTLDLVAAMEKRANGWYYAEWLDLNTEAATFSGRPGVCVNCHSAGADEVMAFGFPE